MLAQPPLMGRMWRLAMHHGIAIRYLAQWSAFKNYYHFRILLSPPRNSLSIFSRLLAHQQTTDLAILRALLTSSFSAPLPGPLRERMGPQLPASWPAQELGDGKGMSQFSREHYFALMGTFVILAPFQPWCWRNRWSPATIIPSWEI